MLLTGTSTSPGSWPCTCLVKESCGRAPAPDPASRNSIAARDRPMNCPTCDLALCQIDGALERLLPVLARLWTQPRSVGGVDARSHDPATVRLHRRVVGVH
jgi:hypothetical protein